MRSVMSSWLDTILTANYVKLGIPFFLLLIIFEAFKAQQQKKKWYRLNDTINSLTCGIYNQVAGVLFANALFVITYGSIQNKFALFQFNNLSVAAKLGHAVFLFVAVDFGYYWFHRCAHRVNIIWAAHIVHHQSETYNLSTALRQSMFQNCFSWIFYAPLAVLGYPLTWFLAMLSLNNVYQFWIHTQSIQKLPWFFELIFNTPSHHRVHHGRNTEYLDKNYAGTLIVWDKLFGTFEHEKTKASYGITTGLNSWNPLWAQFHYFWHLLHTSLVSPFWSDKIKIWYKPPDWKTKQQKEQAIKETPVSFTIYNPPVSTKMTCRALLFFILTLTSGIILAFIKLDFIETSILTSLTIFFSIVTGMIMTPVKSKSNLKYPITKQAN